MEENKSPWIRWSERKPEEGMDIIAMLYPVDKGANYGYQIIYFGGPLILSLVEDKDAWVQRLDDIYWLELPK